MTFEKGLLVKAQTGSMVYLQTVFRTTTYDLYFKKRFWLLHEDTRVTNCVLFWCLLARQISRKRTDLTK